MGFLDHSTNNIIVDAVLTDIGREFLARNDGSFSIVKFALGDDEVDYTMIKKFGRTVGKEKIEKNTPVFEAQTNANLALKYRSISISNPNLVRVPTISLTSTGLVGNYINMSLTGANSTRTVTLKQTITGESLIDPELRDQAFIVKMANQFLTLSGYTPDSVDKDGVATYLILRAASEASDGGSSILLSLAVKSITDTQFTVYGNSTDKTIISTVVSVTGMQSGAVKEFEVQINK